MQLFYSEIEDYHDNVILKDKKPYKFECNHPFPVSAIRVDAGPGSYTQINEIEAVSCVIETIVDFKLKDEHQFYKLFIKDSDSDDAFILETRDNVRSSDVDSLQIISTDFPKNETIFGACAFTFE